MTENNNTALHEEAIVQTPESTPEIKDYLILNIVMLAITCLCIGCTPAIATGILGVVFATQVKSLAADGKLEEAQKKSKLAKILGITTGALIGATVLFLVAYFVIFFVMYGVMFSAMIAGILENISMLVL